MSNSAQYRHADATYDVWLFEPPSAFSTRAAYLAQCQAIAAACRGLASCFGLDSDRIYIPDRGRTMRLDPGDRLIRDAAGGCVPCPPAVFGELGFTPIP